MKVQYKVDSEGVEGRRALWDNLVIGLPNRPLGRHAAFRRIGNYEALCSFVYLSDAAVATVYRGVNEMTIESESAGQLRMAEAELLRICASKGVPIVEDVGEEDSEKVGGETVRDRLMESIKNS